ncbi:MAG: Na+ dependent nucleoside transporter domain protein [Verrucomicrobia bacterium]|nr:Na+ dependent nucleoside transporter domain protein [Verrucomicrobiota bacterium]
MKLISLAGILALIGVAWLLSEHRRRFPFRAVLWGVALQFSLGWFILKTGPGEGIFEACQKLVGRFIGFANEGNRLMFGPLADEAVMSKAFGPENALFFALVITGIIVLISTVSSILYHYGLLQLLVRAAAWVMRRAMGTSGSETLSAAANIFMGQTEAPLVIKPYLPRMTRSELHCLMVGGFATIAGSVMGVYSGLLKVPAGHLLTASVMSAPAALLISKILIPETEASETAAGSSAKIERETVNGIDAACSGAGDGMKLAINVIAMLLAFTSLVAAANWILGEAFGVVGWQTRQPLQTLLGYANAPFAWLMGIPSKDCLTVGQILGERIVLTEFVGYISLSRQQASLDPRSYVIAAYALCGFANFGSVAIQIGGIGALVPGRRKDLAQVGLKAMLGGLLACYMTACVVGVLI